MLGEAVELEEQVPGRYEYRQTHHEPVGRPTTELGCQQLTWAEEQVSLYHYRDRDGYEVDAVLERNSGEVVGIEVKLAETVRSDDFRSLRRLQRRLGDRMVAGFVLYAGEESLAFGDRLRCLPISALWQVAP